MVYKHDAPDSGNFGLAKTFNHETANMLNAIPEPSSSALLGLGGLALLLNRNRKVTIQVSFRDLPSPSHGRKS